MHRLQQHILQELIRHPSRRYSELKPPEVEGNLFMYHLRELTKDGFVQKSDDGTYCLTNAGQAHVDRYSLKLAAQRAQPRLVTMVTAKNDQDEWLFYRRHRQPLIGQAGFIYGSIHLGEVVAQAAARELEEKSGYIGQLNHRGDGYIYVYEGDEVVSAIMFHLFIATHLTETDNKNPDTGEHFWASSNLLSANEAVPGTHELIKLIESGTQPRFWAELNYRM